MSNKITLRFDASSMVESACNYRLKLIVVDGFREKLPWNDVQYGSAFHKFISEMFITKGHVAKSLQAAYEIFNRPCQVRDNKKHLTERHLTKTCLDYWEHFAQKDNFEVFSVGNRPLVEVDFCIKIYEDEKYIIEVAGTIDKIGQIINGPYAIGDYKTHSLWSMYKSQDGKANAKEREFNIKKYFKSHEMATQLRFYLTWLRAKGRENPDTEFGKICSSKSFGAFIDGVFLSSTEDTLFRRSEMFMWKPEELDEFEFLMRERIVRFVQLLHKYPDYAMRDGLTCGACVDGKYPCGFTGICQHGELKIRQMILKQHFIQRQYNPLEFSK